jgi:hypothetical protein
LSPAKSPARAIGHSLSGTVLPLAAGIGMSEKHGGAGATLALTGFLVGPSLGHFYAGQTRRAFTGIAIRSASLAGFVAGLALSVDGDGTYAALGTVSLVVGASSMVVDIVNAGSSASRYNRESLGQSRSIQPLVLAGKDLRLGVRAAF